MQQPKGDHQEENGLKERRKGTTVSGKSRINRTEENREGMLFGKKISVYS